jgi:hypothetical protein
VVDASALQIVLAVLTGWLDRRERQAFAFLMEENRILLTFLNDSEPA